jgi:ankyrin repeat protein
VCVCVCVCVCVWLIDRHAVCPAVACAQVEALLHAGADADAVLPDGRAVIHLAAAQGDTAVLRMLLQGMGGSAGADHAVQDGAHNLSCSMGDVPAAHAWVPGLWAPRALSQSVRSVSEPKRAHAQPKACVGAGDTALHICARARDHESVELLLEEGASTRKPLNNEQESALHLAAENSDVDCVRMLVEYGADVNAASAALGETPLHIVVRAGDEESTTLLLDAPPTPQRDACNASATNDECAPPPPPT